MPKLQVHPDGKLCLGVNHKALAYNDEEDDACGCEPPEPPGCASLPEVACKVDPETGPFAIPDTYKATVESVAICPSAGVSGDSPNRDYYFTVKNFPGVGKIGRIWTLDTSAITALPGITLENFLDIGLTMQGVERSFGVVVGNSGFSTAFSFASLDPFGVVLEDPGNVCGEPTNFANDLASGDCSTSGAGGNYGYGGTVTLTPCPDCAVDCDGSPCATGTLTGEYFFDPSGEYTLHGRARWSSSKSDQILGLQFGHGPAGCYWQWSYQLPEDLEYEPYRGHTLVLYIWYDGKHYRGILTRFAGGEETLVARSITPATITCTDGALVGDIEFELDEGVALTFDLGDCAGECPTDCDECCDTITVDAADVFDFDGPTVLTRDVGGAGSCHWSGTNAFASGTVTITCADGYWYMEFDSPDTSNVVFRASASDPCPPTDGWVFYTNTSGGSPDAEVTSVINSDCPP